ncbi:MAG: hypothetical protein JW820_14840, partial [Spirochaetales bacterium]|nr:hypothetical protein [Spirochaetales bacterium]
MVGQLTAVFEHSLLLQAFWGFLVVNSVKGAALFLLVWTALKIFRGLPSELRHLVWLLVIVSSAVFPAVWLLAPELRLAVPMAAGRPGLGGPAAPLAAMVPLSSRAQFLEIMVVPGIQSVIAEHHIVLLQRSLPYLLGGVWACGAVLLLQRLVVGRVAASLLLRRAHPAPVAPGFLEELKWELGIRGRITIAVSRECGIPFTFGLL